MIAALTIAGTDPTGGAGIQADLKTFQEREVYGMSVITSVVAQNTFGVQAIHHLPPEMIERQLAAVLEDIPPQAVKTGMIATEDMMKLIADALRRHRNLPYVLDPVMFAKSGHALMEEASRHTLRDALVPLAAVVTPNIPEACDLLGMRIDTADDVKTAAKRIVHELGAKAALVKGGHMDGELADDLLYDGSEFYLFSAERTDTKHTHGTGCTLSAAIAAELAKGASVREAAATGKRFVTDAIRYTLGLGKGSGPTNHWGYRLQGVPQAKTP